MARKSSRPAKRPSGRPSRRATDDLRRHQLAREVAPDLAAQLDDFLSYYPEIVDRRWPDRLSALLGLAVDIAAWGGLAAPGDQPDAVERLLAAGTVTLDPHLFSWHVLHESGAADPVRAYVKRVPARVEKADPEPASETELAAAADAVTGDVGAFAERLRTGGATHDDAQALATSAALAAMGLVAGRLDDEEYLPPAAMAAALIFLLTGRVLELSDGVSDVFEVVHAQMPHMLEHVRAHAAGEIDEHERDQDEEVEDDGEDGVPPLGEQLARLDRDLASIADAERGAEAARELAHLLLAISLPMVVGGPFDLAVQLRLLAALGATRADTLAELADAMDGLPWEELLRHLGRAARLARAELPPEPARLVPVDSALEDLETIVRELQATSDEWEDLDDSAVGALGLLTAAESALRIAVDLEPDSDGVAATLYCLDPLALADRPPLRARAADTLDELAGVVADLAS